LRALNATSVLIEEDYIDRDFSEAYSAFYAKTFRRHSKLCTRLLFFASDISFLNTIADVLEAARRLSGQSFLGQVILRPISRASLGLALLKPPPAPNGYESDLLVRAEYSAHVLGAELRVDAVPMTQQDSRVGACAQAAIWVATRHFHTRHRGPWLSTVAITQAAVATAEVATNLHVPAGSEFLTGNNMVAALRAAGRETLIYAKKGQGNQATWGAIRPADVIDRYIDSGIPVIVGLQLPGQDIGHAIVVTGHILGASPRNSPLPPDAAFGEYCEAFYVNDDQVGANVRVAIATSGNIGETIYSIEGNAVYLMVPLPTKVYLPAETAEALAWNAIRSYAGDWPAFKVRHSGKLGSSEPLGDSFVADVAAGRAVARTYLTYGWRYKSRGIGNKFSNPVRQVIRNLEVPRFVYVTEFATTDTLTGKSKYERRIVAHCVIDATAKHQELESILLMHGPGFCSWYAHDATGGYRRSVAAIENSTTYYPKVRGEADFSKYEGAAS
jgi:hypothetical protein